MKQSVKGTITFSYTVWCARSAAHCVTVSASERLLAVRFFRRAGWKETVRAGWTCPACLDTAMKCSECMRSFRATGPNHKTCTPACANKRNRRLVCARLRDPAEREKANAYKRDYRRKRDLNGHRREKFRNDPEYRAKVLARNKAYLERTKARISADSLIRYHKQKEEDPGFTDRVLARGKECRKRIRRDTAVAQIAQVAAELESKQ